MSSFLFSSYLLHFNCKFVVQKKGTLKAPEPVRWLEKHQLHTVCLYCPRIVPLYKGFPLLYLKISSILERLRIRPAIFKMRSDFFG